MLRASSQTAVIGQAGLRACAVRFLVMAVWALALVLAFPAPGRAETYLQPASNFASSGDEIEGWFWLRDPGLAASAEYVFNTIPRSGDLVLQLEALATDRASGGPGFPARIELLFGFPGSGRMGGVFQVVHVELPNVSPDGDTLGYLTRGAIRLPRYKVEQVLPASGALYIRIVRRDAADPHVALNATSVQLQTRYPGVGGAVGGDINGQLGAPGSGSGAADLSPGGTAADARPEPPVMGTLPDTTSLADATALADGAYLGSLSHALGDEDDWYAVELDEGQILVARLALPEGLSATLRLRSPLGSVRSDTAVAGGSSGQIRRAADTAGVWSVQISRRGGAGDYGLYLDIRDQNDAGLGTDAGNQRADAMPIDPGMIVGEVLRGDDVDWYAIAMEAGEIIEVQLAAPEAGRVALSLKSPSGATRRDISVAAGGVAQLRYAANVEGQWLLYVHRSQGEGTYVLTVVREMQTDGGGFGDASDVVAQARPLEPGPQFGQLLAADDRDVFTVAAERGDIIALRGQWLSETLRGTLSLNLPAGSNVLGEALSPNEATVLRYGASVAGDWVASLRRSGGTGPYSVEAVVTPQNDGGSGTDAGACADEAVPLVDPLTNGWMLRGDNLDCYAMSLAAGEQVQITLRTDSRLRTSSLSLRSAGGAFAAGVGAADEGGNVLTFRRDFATDAKLSVRRTSGDGPYRLDVLYTPSRGGTDTTDATGGLTPGGTGGAGGTGDTGTGGGGSEGAGGGGADGAIAVSVADGGRRIVSDKPFRLAAGDPLDTDGDRLHQAWEDQALALVAPKIELDEEENWLDRRPGHQMVRFARVAPYPNIEAPTHVFFYTTMAWTRDYGRLGIGVPLFDENVRAHNGDLETAVLAFAISDPQTLDLVAVYTTAHHSETLHSGVWAARGESCNVGSVFAGRPEWICATLQFEGDRLQLQSAEDKHSIYPTAAACEDVQLFLRIGLPFGGPETGFGEDCGGGEKLIPVTTNVGEPDVPLPMDLSQIFPGEDVWADHGFCGGRGATYETNLPCAGPIRAHLAEPPDMLVNWLGGWRPTEPTLLGQIAGDLNAGADQLVGGLGTLLGLIEQIDVPLVETGPINLQTLTSHWPF